MSIIFRDNKTRGTENKVAEKHLTSHSTHTHRLTEKSLYSQTCSNDHLYKIVTQMKKVLSKTTATKLYPA